MSVEERKTIAVLKGLSRKLPTQKILKLYASAHPIDEFDGKV